MILSKKIIHRLDKFLVNNKNLSMIERFYVEWAFNHKVSLLLRWDEQSFEAQKQITATKNITPTILKPRNKTSGEVASVPKKNLTTVTRTKIPINAPTIQSAFDKPRRNVSIIFHLASEK